jgi:hypothetical protein
VLTVPVVLVLPEVVLRLPQAPAGLAAVVKVTVSPETLLFAASVTLAVIVEVLAPSALMFCGLRVRLTLLEGVWVIVAEPVPPLKASVAVIVQVPAVVDAWYVLVN